VKRIHIVVGLLLAASSIVRLSQAPAVASEFGAFSVKPGETQQIAMGGSYRRIRLCNDAGSAGTLDVTIDDQPTHHLLPGVCAEDRGDSVVLRNSSTGMDTGVYRPVYDMWDGP
jgi:hypothetical protein